MYLESSTERNSGYYAKFGFRVVRDVVFERCPEPIRMFIMVREPQTPRPVSCATAMMSAVSGSVRV